MWIFFVIVAAAAFAFLGTAIGLGFFAIPVALVLVGIAVWVISRKAVEASAGTRAPSDTRTPAGYAHPGQEHMTPEQAERRDAHEMPA